MPCYIRGQIFCSIIAFAKMEFITSNKGSKKLCYAGHAYTKKNQSKTTVRWECTQCSARQCKGALITDLAVSNLMIITNYTYIIEQFSQKQMFEFFHKKKQNKNKQMFEYEFRMQN